MSIHITELTPVPNSLILSNSSSAYTICKRIIENMEYIYEQATGQALISLLSLNNLSARVITNIPLHILFTDHKLLTVYRRGWSDSIDHNNRNFRIVVNNKHVGPKLEPSLAGLPPEKILSIVQYCKKTINTVFHTYETLTSIPLISPKISSWINYNLYDMQIQDLLSDDILAAVYNRGWNDQEASFKNMKKMFNNNCDMTPFDVNVNCFNDNNNMYSHNQQIQPCLTSCTTSRTIQNVKTKGNVNINNTIVNIEKNLANHNNIAIIKKNVNINITEVILDDDSQLENPKNQDSKKEEELSSPQKTDNIENAKYIQATNDVISSNEGDMIVKSRQPFPSTTCKNYNNNKVVSKLKVVKKNKCRSSSPLTTGTFEPKKKLKKPNNNNKFCNNDQKSKTFEHTTCQTNHINENKSSNTEEDKKNNLNFPNKSISTNQKHNSNNNDDIDDILNFINREILHNGNIVVNNCNANQCSTSLNENNSLKKKKKRRNRRRKKKTYIRRRFYSFKK